MRIAGLSDGCRVYHPVLRQLDWLLGNVPDRKYRTQDEREISQIFEYCTFLLFRTDEQRIGRFEALVGESILFHIACWVNT